MIKNSQNTSRGAGKHFIQFSVDHDFLQIM
jgi:hypothetical protein